MSYLVQKIYICVQILSNSQLLREQLIHASKERQVADRSIISNPVVATQTFRWWDQSGFFVRRMSAFKALHPYPRSFQQRNDSPIDPLVATNTVDEELPTQSSIDTLPNLDRRPFMYLNPF